MSAAAAASRKGGKGGKVKRGPVASLQRADHLRAQLRAERQTLEELKGDANLYSELAELESIAAANEGEDDDDLPETEYDYFIKALKYWAEKTEDDEPLTARELTEILNATTGETLEEKQAGGELLPDLDFVACRLGEVKETVAELPSLDVIQAQIGSVSAEIASLEEQLVLPHPDKVTNPMLWLRYMFITDEAVRREYLSRPYDAPVDEALRDAETHLEGGELVKEQFKIVWKSFVTPEAKQPTRDAFQAWRADRVAAAAAEPAGSAE